MREIKFRAWDLVRKRLVNDITFTYDEDDNFNNMYDENSNQIEDKIIMQFTGLKDKNGKEIYEGDIVIIWDSVRQHAYKKIGNPKGEIIFNEAEFYFKSKDVSYESIAGHCLNYRVEIIGNIYENPELLK